MIKLSIIIPCYNAESYIHELISCIEKQITDEVEVVVIDDGSKEPLKLKKHKWLKCYKQRNKGVSAARNKGLVASCGELIWFVDADDLISENAFEYILSRYDEEWDYMDLSWKSLEDNTYTYKLNSDTDALSNPSASTRVFRRSFIGDVRFNEKKDTAEDEDFTRHLGINRAKHICATEYLYYYRITTPGSKYKMFLEGRTKTKRIGYYFHDVTPNMDYLIDEIKVEDETNEVMLMTYKNDIPELEKYCQVIIPPKPMRVTEVRGESSSVFTLVPKVLQTQVVIYKTAIDTVGGIETFIYSFCKQMSKYYDITVLCDSISNEQLARLIEIVPVVRNNHDTPIVCDTLILNSIGDRIPRNVSFKKSIQMTHCIKQRPEWNIPQDRDVIVNVSYASKNSFGEQAKDGIVIHNLTTGEEQQKALLLVSALRVGADDKQGNDARCIKFAKMLDDAGIKYIWLYFGNRQMTNEPQNMIYCGLRLDIKPFIAKADYLVQLSGSEAFSYSLLEALEQQTPVIVTPLEQNKDMRIVDGENAYIVPFEVDGFDVKKILQVPKFTYKHDNEGIIEQWRKLLGDTTPQGGYKPKKTVKVKVTVQYKDLQRNELMKIGSIFEAKMVRALELQNLGFVRIIE